jgi:hypothetical protein
LSALTASVTPSVYITATSPDYVELKVNPKPHLLALRHLSGKFLLLALQKCRLSVLPRKSQCLQGLSAARNRQSIRRQHADKLARQSSQVEPDSRMPMNKDDSRDVQICLAWSKWLRKRQRYPD